MSEKHEDELAKEYGPRIAGLIRRASDGDDWIKADLATAYAEHEFTSPISGKTYTGPDLARIAGDDPEPKRPPGDVIRRSKRD